MLKYIICDIDGTIAKRVTDRSPYDMTRVSEDEVKQEIKELLLALNQAGIVILYFTGRTELARKDTLEWIRINELPILALHMRQLHDKRQDFMVKRDMFKQLKKQFFTDPLFILDDRDSVVRMWRKLGLTCLQVAPGKF